MSNVIPNFFCEFCGAQVDKWAVKCDKCGSVFDSIKCPKCSFVGKADKFPNGCPQCGFQSSSLDKLRDSIMKAHGNGAKLDLETGSLSAKGESHLSKKSKSKKHFNSDTPLPAWAYGVITLALIFGISGMAFFMFKILTE